MYAHEPVNRYMTEAVLSVDLRSPAAEVLRLFAGYPVHHLPVLDDSKVVGMLGVSDFLKLKGFVPKFGSAPLDYLSRHVRIDQIMRQPAITIRPHESIEAAAALMAEHGIHALPVTNESSGLLGIITTTDIICSALHMDLRGDRYRQRDSSSEPQRSAEVRISPSELEEATRLAALSSGMDNDAGKLARALLHQRAQIKLLENVRICAERYLSAGQDERLHALLTKTLAQAREATQQFAMTRL